jgi:transposase
MEQHVGLDVSLKLTAICIVDRTGKIEPGQPSSRRPEGQNRTVIFESPYSPEQPT